VVISIQFFSDFGCSGSSVNNCLHPAWLRACCCLPLVLLFVMIVGQTNGGYGRAARGGASDARYQPYSR